MVRQSAAARIGSPERSRVAALVQRLRPHAPRPEHPRRPGGLPAELTRPRPRIAPRRRRRARRIADPSPLTIASIGAVIGSSAITSSLGRRVDLREREPAVQRAPRSAGRRRETRAAAPARRRHVEVVERPLAQRPGLDRSPARADRSDRINSSSSIRSATGISISHSARGTPGSRKYGWNPNEIGTATSPVASTSVAIVSVESVNRRLDPHHVRERERRHQPGLGGEVEARGQHAAVVRLPRAARPPSPAAPASSPWIGWPWPSRWGGGEALSRSTSRPATSNRRLLSTFAHGWSSGIPIVEWSTAYWRRPPRCPRISSPRWRREAQTMPGGGDERRLELARRRVSAPGSPRSRARRSFDGGQDRVDLVADGDLAVLEDVGAQAAAMDERAQDRRGRSSCRPSGTARRAASRGSAPSRS